MKKIALVLIAAFFIFSCDGNGKKKDVDEDTDLIPDSDQTEDIDNDEIVDDSDGLTVIDEDETNDEETSGPVICSSTEDCQEKERSAGFICSDSRCIPCETDTQCKNDPLFGEYGACETGRCSVSPGCLDAGCEGSEICDETTRLCRDKYNCDNDICKEKQKCHDSGDGVDDYCLKECVSGYIWDSTSLICKSVAANCQPGKENSLYETCLAEFKVCVEEDDNVYCSECIDGYRDSEGTCVKKIKCSDLSCPFQNRTCMQSDSENDAYCYRCFPGYLESVTVTNNDFNDSDIEATGWTVVTGDDTGFNANDEVEPAKLWDFSNCVILHPDESGSCSGSKPASVEQAFATSFSGAGKKLSVRFATKDESGSLDKDVLITIKIEAFSPSEWKTLYSNKVSSYDGVQEKIFDLSGYTDISKVKVEANCGGIVAWDDENLVLDWARIYSDTPLEGSCAKMIGTNCNSDGSNMSILKQCETEHRGCEMVDETSASCDDCKKGYVEVNGICELKKTCDMLICENDHKECVESPNAYCGDCFSGFIKNEITGKCGCPGGMISNSVTDSCEDLIDCTVLTCGEDEFCIDSTDTTHAICSRCKKGEAYDKHNKKCISCSLCVGQGETGRVYPVISLQGHCVCETIEGYFHSSSAPVGTRKCDADGDGWITKEAEESINAIEDSAEKVNARCDLRYVDRIILQNDLFERKQIRVSDIPGVSLTKIPLYEPKNRDVQTYLIDDSSYGGTTTNYAPKYGETGVLFSTSELNPLTKACASTDENSHLSDYNANGSYDVDELGFKTNSGSSQGVMVFTMFSYFLELHNSWFEKNEYLKYGSYVIAEKSRSEFAEKGFSVPLGYGNDKEDKYWRSCLRFRDSDYSEGSEAKPFGLDFANYSNPDKCNPGADDSWCGMHHHSQFKCIAIIEDSETFDPNYPHHIKLGELDSKYRINKCNSTEESSKSLADVVKNPSDRQINCEMSDSSGESKLVWISVDYEAVSDFESYEYVNGCISECGERNELPENMICEGDASCRDDTDEGFGKIYCYKDLDTSDVYTNMTFSMGTAVGDGVYDPSGIDEFVWKGSDENFHDVTLTYFYSIAKTEITIDQFIETMKYNPSKYDCQNAVCPVENVSFYDALVFANKSSAVDEECYSLSDIVCADGRDDVTDYCTGQGGIQSATVVLNNNPIQTCKGYRLPTEAEWEYVAGSGYEQPNYDDRPFFLGDITVFDCGVDPILDQIGWYCGNSESESQLRTHPVATKRATDWGVYDMNGNVAEWVWDTYSETLGQGVDPVIHSGSDIVIRGGSFQSNSQECRSSSRSFMPPSQRSGSVGFRIVKTID